jgi:hypothetical protein
MTDFHHDTYVVRTMTRGDKCKQGSFVPVWAYWEITSIGDGQWERLHLFNEPLTDADWEAMPRMLKIEPMTVPARDAIDAAREAGGLHPIDWTCWYLANPEIANV